MYKLIAACGCSIGRIRSNNEDNFFFNGITLQAENRGLRDILFASGTLDKPFCAGVFDGMGGEAFGEEAASIAAKTLKECCVESRLAAQELLLDAFGEANDRICREARRRATGMMGTTMVALWLEGEEAVLLNAGDSKGFLFRDGALKQLSVDHTDRARLERLGITNRKPSLTQHLGIDPADMILDPALWRGGILASDRFLLCSDGLTDMVSEQEITDILQKQPEPSDSVRELINRAIARGGRDNITVIVCCIL